MKATKVQDELDDVYDYIVVGAGTSGCVVASRLSENPNYTVLILEAGGDDRAIKDIAIPGRCSVLGNMDCEWGFQITPQANAFKGYKHQVYNSVCGKVLGGSGSINYMMYMRGTPQDYDTWKNMGCTGWGYDDVLPYFIKSETCLNTKLMDSGFHGTSGTMMISEASHSVLAGLFIKAGKEMGYKETDCNSDNPIGFMKAQCFIGDGVRQSSSECFLRPASVRPNLHIAVHSYVTKVLIENKQARGVQISRFGSLQKIRARREVILSGGAYCSPKILLHSGIGPKQHLEEVGIPVVQDLPVGNNLQEHTAVLGLEFETGQSVSGTVETLDTETSFGLYEKERIGPLSVGMLDATALIRTKYQHSANPNPDVQLITHVGMVGTGKYGRAKNMAGITDEVFDAMFEGNEGKHGFSIIVLTTGTKSRGTVRLATCDPFHNPLIDHQTLSDEEDVYRLIEGVKFALELTKTEAFQSVGARHTSRVLPTYKETPFTDEYWAEYVQTLTNTYHPCGTCKMGRMEDLTAVVDPQLRVKGVDYLRVADASVMPNITSANLNATCVMIGEKASDLITKSARRCEL